MHVRPQAVVFDVFHTVLSLEPLRTGLHDLGLDPAAFDGWFAATLRDGLALAATGGFAPFREVGEGTLAVLLARAGRADDEAAINRFFSLFGQLSPHADVEPALRRLRDRRVPMYALTNGDAVSARDALGRAGLDRFFERILSIDEVRQWKPRREVYLHAANAAGVEPGRLAMVAAHPWDLHGAKAAGLLTAWVRREPGAWPPALARPDVDGGSLEIVCARLA
jgi:2-haloacid dehalogenase